MKLEPLRLLLRATRFTSVPFLCEFLCEAEAMRTLRECQRHVTGPKWQRRRTGCAPWTVVDKQDQRITGWGWCPRTHSIQAGAWRLITV